MKKLFEEIDNLNLENLDEVDMSIDDVIQNLKDTKFKNAAKRKDFLKYVTILALSNDPKARSLIGQMSKWLDDIGEPFLKVKDKEIFDVPLDGNARYEVDNYRQDDMSSGINDESYTFKSSHKSSYGILNEKETENISE